MATAIFNLPQGNYGPVTHLKTSTYTPPAGVSLCTLTVNVSAADMADATKEMNIFMECSPDGGSTWQFQAGYDWLGGQLDKHGNPESGPLVLTFGIGNMIGELCRLDITLNSQFTALSASVSVS